VVAADEVRAGRPRVARLQVGGHLEGVAAVPCPASVDGDAPGPYPGEDRSSRSRGSAKVMIASSVGGLCPPELIAGGFGNPPRVPIWMQGGLGPARPHKPGTRSVRFRPLQPAPNIETRPRVAILLISAPAW